MMILQISSWQIHHITQPMVWLLNIAPIVIVINPLRRIALQILFCGELPKRILIKCKVRHMRQLRIPHQWILIALQILICGILLLLKCILIKGKVWHMRQLIISHQWILIALQILICGILLLLKCILIKCKVWHMRQLIIPHQWIHIKDLNICIFPILTWDTLITTWIMLHLILTLITRDLSVTAMNGTRNLLIHMHKCQGLHMDLLNPPSSAIARIRINLQTSTKLSHKHRLMDITILIIITIVYITQMSNPRRISIFPALHNGTTVLIYHNPIIHLIKYLVQCHRISLQIPMKHLWIPRTLTQSQQTLVNRKKEPLWVLAIHLIYTSVHQAMAENCFHLWYFIERTVFHNFLKWNVAAIDITCMHVTGNTNYRQHKMMQTLQDRKRQSWRGLTWRTVSLLCKK